VVIDGRHRHGRMGLLGFDARNQERVVIDGKDYTLDFTEPRDDPLAGPSLAAATALLTEGLANLPNLATKAPEPNTMGFSLLEKQALSIDFDFDEEEAFSSL
jgi:hypothetical protein